MGLTRHDVCLHAVRMVQSCEDRRLRSYKLDIVGRAGFTDWVWTCSGRKRGPGVVYIVKKWLTDWVWTCSGRKRGPGVVYRKEVVGGGIYRFGLDM
jgi:hypothetical protein